MLTRAQKKYLRSLQLKKFRQRFGKFVAETPKVVEELMNSPLRIDEIFALTSYELKKQAATLVSDKDLEMISGLKVPNQVFAVVQIPPQAEIEWNVPMILALDGVRDPGNLGTILRLAEWFGLRQVILSSDCAEPWNPKVVQSAMGSLFRMQLIERAIPDFLDEAKARSFATVGAEMDGAKVAQFTVPDHTVLVMGSESHGLRPDVQTRVSHRVKIPKVDPNAPIDSLNVGVAAGILLSHLTR